MLFRSDPDVRPDFRNQSILLTRWNHHFDGMNSTLRTSYRYYRDTYGVQSHTVDLQWVQPISLRWILTPGLRYYTQNAARFYVDPPASGAPCCGTIMRIGSGFTMFAHSFRICPLTM